MESLQLSEKQGYIYFCGAQHNDYHNDETQQTIADDLDINLTDLQVIHSITLTPYLGPNASSIYKWRH